MDFRSPSVFRATAAVAMLIVLAIILYESSQMRGQPGVPELTTNEAYVGHFVIYAVVAFCAVTALGRPTLLTLGSVLVLSMALGIAMELYQMHVPTRTASSLDAMADTAGAMAGLIAYTMAVALLEPLRKLPTKF